MHEYTFVPCWGQNLHITFSSSSDTDNPKSKPEQAINLRSLTGQHLISAKMLPGGDDIASSSEITIFVCGCNSLKKLRRFVTSLTSRFWSQHFRGQNYFRKYASLLSHDFCNFTILGE